MIIRFCHFYLPCYEIFVIICIGDTMNGFEKRKEILKKNIKEAAFALFRVYGIQGVKMTDIAKKADVSKVSIYNFFGSKMNLVKNIIFDFMDQAYLEMREIMNQELSFDKKFNQIFNLSYQSFDKLREGDSDGLINNELIQNEEVQIFLREYSEKKIKPLFRELISQGQREGSVDETLDITTVFLYIQTMQTILNSSLTIKQRNDLGKLIFYGIRGK